MHEDLSDNQLTNQTNKQTRTFSPALVGGEIAGAISQEWCLDGGKTRGKKGGEIEGRERGLKP